jgi:Undecaprenyl-phosphate galactose phosphotransferase WbaP
MGTLAATIGEKENRPTRLMRSVLMDAVVCFLATPILTRLYLHSKPAWYSMESFEAVSLFLNTWLVTLAALSICRLTRLAATGRELETAPIPVVILGPNNGAQELYRAFTEAPTGITANPRALRIAAIFADEVQALRAENLTESFRIRCGIVPIPRQCDTKTVALIEQSARIFRELYIAPQIAQQGVTAKASMEKKSAFQIQVGKDSSRAGTDAFKRLADVTGSLALGLVTLPVAALIAAVIRLTSEGPILYRHIRIGKGNRLFHALKFRTMFVDASERLSHCLAENPSLRAEWESVHKLKSDPRVTPIGRLLRRFSLDELPQIWNALVGEMSLIGPRPIIVSEIERYGQDYSAYEAVRPGLTGLWQVSGRNDTSYQQRVDYDAYYVRNWSMKLDAQIIAKTFRAVISGTGAY